MKRKEISHHRLAKPPRTRRSARTGAASSAPSSAAPPVLLDVLTTDDLLDLALSFCTEDALGAAYASCRAFRAAAVPQADVGRASQAAARRCERRRGGVDIARKRIQIRGRRNRDRSARFLPAICRIARAAGTSVGTRTSVGTSARALTPPLQGRRGIYAKRQ